jgi:hypothetical protein
MGVWVLVRLHDNPENLTPLVGNSGTCLAACRLQVFESCFGLVAQWNLLQTIHSLFGMTIQLARVESNEMPNCRVCAELLEASRSTVGSP